jgi:hypothetical protein
MRLLLVKVQQNPVTDVNLPSFMVRVVINKGLVEFQPYGALVVI